MIAHGINKSNPGISSESADTLLWDNFRRGSKEAFEAIYNRHIDQLYNYGMHIVFESTLVEDSVQDLFLELWQRRQFLGDTDSLRFYLYKSLKRKILRKVKTRENADRRYLLTPDYEQRVSESSETATIREERRKHTSEILLHAIKDLPERQRQIIVYRFYENLSSMQISSAMALNIDATYTLLSKSLQSLKKIVRERYPFFILLAVFF